MDECHEGGGIDQPVQAFPVAPQPLLPAVGRGDCERRQHQQCRETDGEIEALGDLGGDHDQVPLLVEHIDQEMSAGIQRRRHADAPADLDQRHPVEQRPRRGHEERQQQQGDGPVAGSVGRQGHWPRLQCARVPAPSELQRGQAEPHQRRESQPEYLALNGHDANLGNGAITDRSNLCHPGATSRLIGSKRAHR